MPLPGGDPSHADIAVIVDGDGSKGVPEIADVENDDVQASDAGSGAAEDPDEHKLSLIQACAANTMNMFGTGPFITIPFVIAETEPAGPHAMLGYTLAGLICCCDSFTWAELGAMMPYSGGSYVYLRECFGSDSFGRLASFMFLFQFILSGPLEVSSGFVAMAQYLSYMDGVSHWAHHCGLGTIFCAFSILALYNDMKEVGKMLEILGGVTVFAIAFTIISGFSVMEPEHFKAPDTAYDNAWLCFYGMFGAARIGVYDFTGYYDANQMGDEVRNPRHVIPRAGVTTACVVTLIFLAVYLAVIAAVPWGGPDGFAQKVADGDDSANYIMASFGESIGGFPLACIFCILVILTIFGSCFAQLLGYSQIPYTAAKEGYFWEFMAHEHPTKRGVADYSLFSVGAVALLGCWLPLELLISAMVTSLCLSQFLSQAVGVVVYRRMHPEVHRPFPVPWYPLPVIFSGIGFVLIWITSPSYLLYGDADEPLVELSLFICFLGIALYHTWAYRKGYWPFAQRQIDEDEEAKSSCRDEHDRRFSPRPDVAAMDVNLNVVRVRNSPRSELISGGGSQPIAPGLEQPRDGAPLAAASSHLRPRSVGHNSPVPLWLGGWRGIRTSPKPEEAFVVQGGTRAPPVSPQPAPSPAADAPRGARDPDVPARRAAPEP